jgi:type I restriction enzyme S subunit
MTYPIYPAYKDSGVPWLGMVPEGWDVRKLKNLASSKRFAIVDGPFGTQLKASEYRDEGIPLVRIANLSYTGKLDAKRLVFISEEKAIELERSSIGLGDVIMAKTGATIGKTGYNDNIDRGIIASSCLKFTPNRDRCFGKYATYIMTTPGFTREVINASGGSTRDTINTIPFKVLQVCVPPLPEQQQIARFLDYKTSLINKFIRNKKKLIALLKEQKQNIINQAVTGKIDVRTGKPYPKYKDSGIEWLGQVPEGWEVLRFRRLIKSMISGMTPSKDNAKYWGGEMPWVSPKDMKITDIGESQDHITQNALNETGIKVIPASAVLFVVRGMILRRDFPVGITVRPVTINQDMKAITLHEGFSPKYMSLLFSGMLQIILRLVEESGHGTRKLKTESWMNMLLPMPDLEMQKEIIKWIENKRTTFDLAISRAEREIELIQEYRTRLISDAVTGKIDVRNVQLNEQTQENKDEERDNRRANVYFKRSVFAAEIIHQLHDEPTFGHVKFEKVMYLCEKACDVDTGSHYYRQAAGPYDNRALRSIDSQIAKQQWYKAVKLEGRYQYIPLAKAGKHHEYFQRYFASKEQKFNSIIAMMKKLNTERCEIVATLYEAWDELLHSTDVVSNEQIVYQVLYNWHPSKQRIPKERWLNALEWMRDNKIAPIDFHQ